MITLDMSLVIGDAKHGSEDWIPNSCFIQNMCNER